MSGCSPTRHLASAGEHVDGAVVVLADDHAVRRRRLGELVDLVAERGDVLARLAEGVAELLVLRRRLGQAGPWSRAAAPRARAGASVRRRGGGGGGRSPARERRPAPATQLRSRQNPVPWSEPTAVWYPQACTDSASACEHGPVTRITCRSGTRVCRWRACMLSHVSRFDRGDCKHEGLDRPGSVHRRRAL